MTTVPDRARVRLPGISSRAYEHPADRSALVAMRKLTGFDVLLRRLAGLFSDRRPRLAPRLAWFAIGFIGLRVIIAGLEEWYRKSELSCDRAGVLASQDPAAARRALMKIAGGSQLSGLSPGAVLPQALEYDAVPDVREGLLKMIQMQGTTHPFAVVRFAELDRWVAEGDYEPILAGNYPRREDDEDTSISEEVRAAARSYQDSWSRSSDPFIGMVKGVAETAAGGAERLFSMFTRPRDGGGDS